jgi:large subunit ribosomal protein L31
MREGIHPAIKQMKVTCLCGNTFDSYSIRNSINVEVCSACHPFFTGQKRVVDTAGRVERFVNRAGKGASYGQKEKPKSVVRK